MLKMQGCMRHKNSFLSLMSPTAVKGMWYPLITIKYNCLFVNAHIQYHA